MMKMKQKAISRWSLVLIGEEWTGKSWAGNNILGRNAFKVKSDTEHVMQDFRVIDGRYVTVVDTPGWDLKCNPDAPLQILKKAYSSALCKEFHILLLIIPICLNQEWNEKFAQRMLDVIGYFNNDMRNHTMLLFTRSSHLQSTGLEGYLEGSGKPIQSLVKQFEHRYHVLNDSTKNNHRKFRELMKKIEQMVQENRGQTLQLVMRKQEVGAMRQHEVDTLINSQLMQGCSEMEGSSSVGDYTFKSLRPTEKYDPPRPFKQSDVLEETGMDRIPGEEEKNKEHLEKSALQRNPEGEAEGNEEVLRQQCQEGDDDDDDELPQHVHKGEGKKEEELQQQCQKGKDDEFPQHIQTGGEADEEKIPQQIIGTTEREPHQSQLGKKNKITQHGCNPGGKNTPQQRKRANADHTLQNKKQDTPKQSKRHKDGKISKHVFKDVKGKPQDIKRRFKTKKPRYIFLGCRKITEKGMTASYPNAADWRLIKRYNNATVLGMIKRYPSIICWRIIKRYPKATCCQMVKRYRSATFWGTRKQYPNIACWGMIKKIHQCGSIKGDKQIPQCNKYKCEENRPQYTRSRDGEEVPQCIRGKDNEGIPQYKRDKNNEEIPENNSVGHDKEIPSSSLNRFRHDDMTKYNRLGHGKEKPQCNKYKHKENIPRCTRSGDGKEVFQCNRDKYNKEILKCTRGKNNEEIPQTKKYKDNEEIPQNTWPGNEKDIPQMTRDKGNNGVPQCNMDKDNEDYRQDNSLGDDKVKPQCTRCRDDEEIPTHNRRTDHKEEHQDKRKWDNADKQQKRKTAQDHEKILRHKKHDQDDEIPQPSKKLEGKKIPKEYRKTDDEIPQCSRKGNEKETPQLTSVGDYKEIIEAPDYPKEGGQFGDSNNKTHYKRPEASKTAVAGDEDARPPGGIWKLRKTKSLERLNEFKKDGDEDTGPPGGFGKLRRTKSLERFDVFNRNDKKTDMIESPAFPVRPAACTLFFSRYCLIPVVLYCAFVSNVCLLMLDCTHESLKSFQGPLKGSYKDLQSASIYCKGVGKVSFMAMGKTSLLPEY